MEANQEHFIKDDGHDLPDEENKNMEVASEEPQKCTVESKSCQSGLILPQYPKHGVIGDTEPAWLDIFYSTRKHFKLTQKQDFKKQKFDFHETYEKKLEGKGGTFQPAPIPGLYNLWRKYNKEVKTVDVYEIDPNLPVRFKNPDLLRGYGWEKDDHALFQTTSSVYGKFPPTVHDVPHAYHGLKNTFTKHLSSTGMPKNRSLNIK